MNPQVSPQRKRSVFSILCIDLENFRSGKPYWHDRYQIRRQHEEVLRALPQGTRVEFLVSHFRPSIEDVEWLPAHLHYCVKGPDKLNNQEWVRLIESGEE